MALGIDDISVTTDATIPSEFTFTWDEPTNVFGCTGFRTVDNVITSMTVSHTLTDYPDTPIVAEFDIYEYMDLNDILAIIIEYLGNIIPYAQITVLVDQPAQVVFDDVLTILYADYDALAPVDTITDSGSGVLVGTIVENVYATPLLHMQGIASARGRMIAWDVENAVYRSAILDPLDFEPDTATQASVGTIQAVRGAILAMIGHPEGFVVYSTDNIIRAVYTGDDFVFKYAEISALGISDPRHVTASEAKHIFWANADIRAPERRATRTITGGRRTT